MFKKLFGGKSNDGPVQTPPSSDQSIRLMDEYGREVFVTREQWRTNLLPGGIKKNWDNPEELYNVLVGALQDGLHTDIIEAVEHLYQIDPLPNRGATMWAITLMKNGRLDDAEIVLKEFLAEHGDDGSILTNLAKIYAERGEDALADLTLERSLQVDPNQHNGLMWYAAIAKDRGGEAGLYDGMRKIAGVPGSWRAQLWLARQQLELEHEEEAMEFYRDAIARASTPIPADLLMQISGDLGNANQLSNLVQLCSPHYVAKIHGLEAGNNLIKANLTLGNIAAAKLLVDELYALQRPDWRKTLDFWEAEIAKANLPKDTQAPLEMTLLMGEGPVWYDPDYAELFPCHLDGPSVVFLMGTVSGAGFSETRVSLADAIGRASRALPLFLCEQLTFKTNATGKTLVPYILGETRGGFLMGSAYADSYATELGNIGNDYVVTCHFEVTDALWIVTVRILRTSDGKLMAQLRDTVIPKDPSQGILRITQAVLQELEKTTRIIPVGPPSAYELPETPWFDDYLLRLEQLLAVRCHSVGGNLTGVREMLDGCIAQCLAAPKNVTVRALLAKMVYAARTAKPEVVEEFESKIAKLQQTHALEPTAQSLVQSIMDREPERVDAVRAPND